jgi:hypothetical protein
MSNIRKIALSLMPVLRTLVEQYNESGGDPDKLINDVNDLINQTANAAKISEFDLHLELEKIESETKETAEPEEEVEEEVEEEKDFTAVYTEWCDANKIHRWEGDPGVENLNSLCKAIGYTGHQFKFGSPLEHFLSDNPGAIEEIIEWIIEWGENNAEWKSALESELEEKEEEDG